MQFQRNYFKDFNEIISPFFIFDSKGNIKNIEVPVDINKNQKNLLLTYLYKIKANRIFILQFYSQIENNTKMLIKNIAKELSK